MRNDPGLRPPADPPVAARPRRSPQARVALVLGVGFTVLAVLYGVVVLLALLLHHHDTTTTALSDVPARISVQVDGSVQVDAAPLGAGSSMTVRRQWTWAEPQLVTTRSGDQLTVRSSCVQLGPFACGTDVRLLVPAGTAVTVRSTDGAVRVSGLRGDVDLGADSGSVTANDVSAAHLRLHSNDGSVRGNRLAVADVTAGSDSGAVRLDLAVEPTRVVASSNDGSVRIAVPGGPAGYRTEAHSNDGRKAVDVRRDDGSARLLQATSDSGAVTITYR
jgi:hypothetical protein